MFSPYVLGRISFVVLERAGVLSVIAVLGTTLMLAACDGTEGRKVEFMERGNQFYAQENYEKARLEFRNVLQIEPKNPAALYKLAQLDEIAQNWGAAFANYQRVIDADGTNVMARVRMGRLALLSDQVDKALELAEESLAKEPGNVDAITLKAGVLAKQQKHAEAMVLARQALEKSPGHIDATILLAGLEQLQGHVDEALVLLKQGVASDPKHIGIKYVMAELLAQRGDIAQGAQVLREVLALKPADLSHRLRLVAYLEAGKDFPQAESVLREALPDDDERASLRLALVNFIYMHGSPEQATAQLQEFISKDPEAHSLQFAFAAERERTEHTKEAIETYRNLIKTAEETPDGLTARSRLARLLAIEGNTAEAEQLLAEVLKKNSNDSEALMTHAGLALTKHDPATAVVDLRNVLRDQPKNGQALKLLAQAHKLNNEQGLAEETLQKAVMLMPKDASVKLALAELFIEQRKFDAARTQVTEVLALDATHLRALETLFKLQMLQKEWPEAQATVATLLKSYPQLPQGDYYKGMVLAAQDKRAEAIEAYRKALDKAPDAVEPLTAIVKIYLAQRQTKEAIAVLDDAIKRSPQNVVAQNLRGELLLLEGHAAEAEAIFANIIEQHANIPSVYRNLGSARLARKDIAGAQTAYESGLKQMPDNEMLLYSMAALDERQGQHERAISHYENFIKRKPNSDMAKNNLAMLLVSHRSDQESLNKARDLVMTLASSDDPVYLDTVGWVHYRRGEVDQALVTLDRALKKVPSAPQINYHLGMVYYTKGDNAAALRHLEEALAAKTEFQGINEARATLNKLKNS